MSHNSEYTQNIEINVEAVLGSGEEVLETSGK